MSQAAQLCEAIRKPEKRKQLTSDTHRRVVEPPMGDTYLDRGFPLKSAISRALQNFMLSGISGISVCGEGFAMRMIQPQELPGRTTPPSTLLSHNQCATLACLPTIPGHIQLHQLHEVSYFRRQPLDLVVTEAQLSQVQ